MSNVFQVYWVDFTISGYRFNRSAMTTLSSMSESMALNPEYCAMIILAPNTGAFGSEYTEEGIRKSVKEVEAILDDHTLQCKYLEFDLSFEPAGIPKQCKRPRRHKG